MKSGPMASFASAAELSDRDDKETERREREYVFVGVHVWCGGCWNVERTRGLNKADALRRLRGAGWRKTKQRGWLCGRCFKRLRKGAR